jgi:hypothetical protein
LPSPVPQALLRAVVEVALQARALRVGGGHDERARGAQPRDAREQLRSQSLVVKREPRRSPELFHEARIVEQTGPVQDERCHLSLLDERRASAILVLVRIPGPPVGIDPTVVDRVKELELRVA